MLSPFCSFETRHLKEPGLHSFVSNSYSVICNHPPSSTHTEPDLKALVRPAVLLVLGMQTQAFVLVEQVPHSLDHSPALILLCLI